MNSGGGSIGYVKSQEVSLLKGWSELMGLRERSGNMVSNLDSSSRKSKSPQKVGSAEERSVPLRWQRMLGETMHKSYRILATAGGTTTRTTSRASSTRRFA